MSGPLLAIIIDDDATSRELLRHKLRMFEALKVVGEAANLAEGRKALAEIRPQVLFLDIQLGFGDGFDLLDAVPKGCKVIFVTSHDEYAVRAFDVNAVDYITKPFDAERLAMTVARLTAGKEDAGEQRSSLAGGDHILVSDGGGARFLRIDDIGAILSGEGRTEVIMADGQRFHVSKSLKHWESRLPAPQFLRINRSTLVNLSTVRGVERWFHGTYRLRILNHPEPLAVGKNYIRKFLDHYSI